jgi:hypothetical protein
MGRSEHEASNQTHQYFISVTENAANILERSTDKASTTTGMPDIATHANIKQLNNRFEHLELEDSTEFAESPAKPPTSSPLATNEDDTESNPKALPEYFFAAYLLFEDMQLIRDFLRQTWLEYKARRMNLIATSVTTNTTIDLVKQPTNEKYPQSKKKQILQQLMCETAGLVRGETFAAKLQPDDPYNMRLADIADWSYITIQMLLASFCAILTPGATPSYKPSYYGTLVLDADHSKMTARERFKENRIIVTEEMTNWAALVQFGMYTRLPVLDEIIAGLVEMMSSKE